MKSIACWANEWMQTSTEYNTTSNDMYMGRRWKNQFNMLYYDDEISQKNSPGWEALEETA